MEKIRLLLSCEVARNYVEAFENLGVETTAKYLPEVDTSFDGLVLCGGSDIHPSRYGEEVDGSVDMDVPRDEAEFALLKAYLEAGKPILGICRGHQLMNVYFGGSLYQDMSQAQWHDQVNDKDSVHPITALPDSVLGKLYGQEFPVNSAHHQAVKKLGDGLRATAYWNGEVVEAMEHTQYPILGVQWHPERMCFRNQREDTVCGADFLQYFVELCRKHRAD